MKLSVVVATFDRLELLRLCLERLAEQDAPKEDYEVIIIDNNGQEDCEKLVTSFGFQYVYEREKGLSHARNRGLKEANSDWVLYLDDDTKVSSGTIREYMKYLPQLKNAGAFGGRFLHWYLEEPAPWLKEEFGNGSRPGTGDSFGVLPEDDYLIGCFFGVNIKHAVALGGFYPELGMKGKEIGWSEETELQFRMRKNGLLIYYAPSLVIHHLVQPWKTSIWGRLRFAYSHGKKTWQTTGTNKYTYGKFISDVLSITFFVVPITIFRWLFRHQEWYWQNALLIVLKKYAFSFGRFSKLWNTRENATQTHS